MACTAARVYCTGLRPDRWSAQGHEGALALLKDRTLGGLFFRLVDMNSVLGGEGGRRQMAKGQVSNQFDSWCSAK